MPRQVRLDAPGALRHIPVRGIDKTNILALILGLGIYRQYSLVFDL